MHGRGSLLAGLRHVVAVSVLLAASTALAAGEAIAPVGVDLAVSDSTSTGEADIWIAVGSDRITVNGITVVSLEQGGAVPAGDQRGSMIPTLYDLLKERGDEARKAATESGALFGGEVLVAVDRDVPFATVSLVTFTASQAQLERPLFQVLGPMPPDAEEAPVTVIEAQLPRIHHDDKSAQDWEAYVAIVRAEVDRLVVSQYTPRPILDTDIASDEMPDPVEHSLPHLSPGPDYGGLESLMVQLKSTCSVCELIILQPMANDSWQSVVALLDATREGEGQTLFPRPVLSGGAE